MKHRERLLELIRERSLKVGDFTLASGAKSRYYVDCRRTTMHAEGQVLVGQLCWELLKASGLDADVVGGLTMGADPVSYAIAYSSRCTPSPFARRSRSTAPVGASRDVSSRASG
jgi:orotate phosphoribosyltransferase